MNLPSLKEFLEAEKHKRISAHRKNGLVGFKYTNETVYTQDWDEVTLNARGVVFDESTGKIVARPFKKFFNYQEFFDAEGNHTQLYDKLPDAWKPNITGGFHCMEKVDGSLGIVFFNERKKHWQVKTGGSFDSEQAIWAQKWFDKNIDCKLLHPNATYLFEIIYNEDIHPIKYDFEGLVLLGIIWNESGNEVDLESLRLIKDKLNVRMVEAYEFNDFAKAVEWAKNLPKTQEGLVITFDNGFKCKAKSDEWCKLARAFEGMTKWNIWVRYDLEKDFFHENVDKFNSYKSIDDKVLFIPEELPEFREYAESIRVRVRDLTNQVMNMAITAKSISDERRIQYEWVCNHHREYLPAVMKALNVLDNRANIIQVKQIIHKLIQPKADE